MSELPNGNPSAPEVAEQPVTESAPVKETILSPPVVVEQPSMDIAPAEEENTPSVPAAAETNAQAPTNTTPPAQENPPQASEDVTPAPVSTDAPAENTTEQKTGIIVHHLENSRSHRLLWTLEEMEIPYTVKLYKRNAEMRAPKEMKQVHPLGKSPILTDGDITVAESGAITEYLIAKYGEKFRPTEAGLVDDIYFSHYAEGSFMPTLVFKIVFTIIPKKSPTILRPLLKPVFTAVMKRMVDPELKAHCDLVESALEKTQTGWIAGGDHPTAADFMMMFPLTMLVVAKNPLVGPKTKEYVKRIHDRPSYKRVVEKWGKPEPPKL